MALELPTPRRGHLHNAPLALVVCQVRYELKGLSFDPAQMFAIHNALGGSAGLYPRVEELRAGGLSVQMGPNGLISGETPTLNGFRLQSVQSDWFVSLMPDHVSLETTSYAEWDGAANFGERIGTLLEAVASIVGPQVEERVGLRYVDRITQPVVRHPAELGGYLTPELLGIALHEAIGPGVLASQQQTEIECDVDVRCTLRNGYAADPTRENALTYILDWDLYRAGIRPFDVSSIRAGLGSFNEWATRLFQAAVTPTMLELMNRERD